MNMDMNMIGKCSICDEIYSSDHTGLYNIYSEPFTKNTESRILYEDDRFVIMPSLGPVADCHLLVFPKKHVCSYAVLDRKSLCEAEKIIREVTGIVRKNYGSSIVFEHGTLEEHMPSSASCTHAHMHIVSCAESLISFFRKDGLYLREIGSLYELTDQKQRKCPYFFYQEKEGEAYVMDDIVQKSQYIRFLVANILRKPECGDWKKNPGILEVNKMLKEMKKEFSSLFWFPELK